MILVGAGAHALEIYDILTADQLNESCFFDNVTRELPSTLLNLPLLHSESQAMEELKNDSRFILSTGNPFIRKKMYDLFCQLGGQPETIKATTAFVSRNEVNLGYACNIMSFALVSARVSVGTGCLINARVNIHHNVVLDDFCEIGPGAILLGGVQVGHQTIIGAGAVVLPGIQIGHECTIGAGAVVTKNVVSGEIVKGNPAR